MKLKSNGMSSNEYKLLLQQIREEEEHKYGTKLNINGYSYEEYIKITLNFYHDLYNRFGKKTQKGFSLFLIKESPYLLGDIILPADGAVNKKDNSAYVLTNHIHIVKPPFLKKLRFKKKATSHHDLVSKLCTIYHEIRHLIQFKNDKFLTYDVFYNRICRIYHKEYPKQYFLYHDSFFHEIEANIYGIDKAEEYIKRYPNLYEENKKYIEKLKNEYRFDKINFDFDNFFSRLIKDNKIMVDGNQNDGIVKIIYEDNELFPYSLYTSSVFDNEKKIINNSILSNKEYIMSLGMENMTSTKSSNLEAILKALKWKKDVIETKILWNKEYISRNKYNLIERLKWRLAKKKLNKKLQENEQLEEYIQNIKKEQNIVIEFQEKTPVIDDNNYVYDKNKVR